jgi:hypothetical protein
MADNLFTSDSVRLDLIRYIESLYINAVDEDPAPVGKKFYGIVFSSVGVGPLLELDNRRLSSIGIVVGGEVKDDIYPYKDPTLEINIEFRYTVNRGDLSTGILAERVLGVVQQIMVDDRTLGGRAIKVDEVQNGLDLVSYSDRTIAGFVRFEVHYRHHAQNVYSSGGSFGYDPPP